MQALHNRLIAKIVPVDESPYEIYLPPPRGSQPTLLKVISIGTECKFVSEGDTIVIEEFSGRPFIVNKQRFYCIDETDVHLILE